MFNFQKTFTSFAVKSDIPRVESLKLKTGFFGETHYKTARVQIWFEDLGAEGRGDASGPTSPTLSDDRSSSTAPSSGLTSASKASNWSHSSTIMPAQRIQKIESSQVVLYTTDDGGERQLIFFISLDQCKLDHDSCCGRSRKLSTRSQQDLTMDTCCDRAVLVAPSKYLTLDRLTQKPDRTPLAIPLGQNFLKHDRIAKDTPRPGVKHVPVKWLAIKFKDMKDKENFVKKFEQLKKLKNIKVGMQNEMLKQARRLEME
ncbi:hypothetical protein K440DRAFT_617772 [Wilcoxina mikolae CBS 423.85]|nr:hypothetical protein K440DRAFT_617772 [Wilcoxina mikolae CBS 423.85]